MLYSNLGKSVLVTNTLTKFSIYNRSTTCFVIPAFILLSEPILVSGKADHGRGWQPVQDGEWDLLEPHWGDLLKDKMLEISRNEVSPAKGPFSTWAQIVTVISNMPLFIEVAKLSKLQRRSQQIIQEPPVNLRAVLQYRLFIGHNDHGMAPFPSRPT